MKYDYSSIKYIPFLRDDDSFYILVKIYEKVNSPDIFFFLIPTLKSSSKWFLVISALIVFSTTSNDDYTDPLIATIEHQFYTRGKKKRQTIKKKALVICWFECNRVIKHLLFSFSFFKENPMKGVDKKNKNGISFL